MKLYGHPYSTCTRKVLLTLEEKRSSYELITIQLHKMEQKQPSFLARQPFGVVPVLEDEGYSLYESRAIIRYLDRKIAGPALSPQEVQAYGKMEQWLGVEQSYFSGPAVTLAKQLVLFPMRGQSTDLQIVEKAKSDIQLSLDVANQNLEDKPYFAGEEFSLADISWMPYVGYFYPAGVSELIESRSHLAAWWKRVSTRPSWLKILELK